MFSLLRPFGRRMTPVATLVVVAACGDSPTQARDPVASISLDRSAVELELQDSVRLVASATTSAGTPVPGAAVSWSSSAPAVARVDAGGVVTGLSAGTATITASSEGFSAQASITVLGWNVTEALVVVDSTVLDLLSDAEERATGVHRFRILQAPAPTFEAGDVVVGAQDLGFLRRVVSSSTAGDVVTLQTEPAALSEVVEEGSFESSIDLVFAPGSPSLIGPVAAGEVRWGEPVFTPAAEGVSLSAAGISLSGLDICKVLKDTGGPACPKEITKFKLNTGTLDFGPQFDLNADFGGLRLTRFRGVLDGTVTADFEIVLEASASVSPIKPQIDVAEITRPFYAQIGPVPVVGYVELALKAGLEAKATAKGSIQAGFTNAHSIQVGATWDDAAGWAPVFQSQRTFDAQLPSLQDGTLSGQIDVETKLFLKPELKIIFYGVVGPFANVEPFGKFTLTFGTSACGMKSEAGINSEIGFTIPFLDPSVGNFSKKNSPWFSWPGRSWDCPLGFLDVSTVTNGSSPDADGYTILVDDVDKGSVGPDAQTTVQFVEVGKRMVTLSGVASNCTVQGNNPREVTVNTGLVAAVPFEIQCQDPGGDLEVQIRTTGMNLDPDGYQLTVGSQSQSVGVNETVTFQGLASGDHPLSLGEVAANCLLIGPNPRTVTVPTGGKVQVTVEIQCAASQLLVQTSTTGTPASSNWSVQVDGTETQAIGPNAQVTFDLAPGNHQVELRDLASNCSVQGTNPRDVNLSGGQTSEVFSVDCAVAGLTVTVQTTGDPSPATTFTAETNSQQQSVGVNGSTTFSSLPQGINSVRLANVPSHCLVQGENPRAVNVPGTVTFDVLCQAPAFCGAPPAPARFFPSDIYEDWDPSEPKPAMTGTIDKQAYGDIAVSASMTMSTTNQSANVLVRVGWDDHWQFIPVDPARLGETVTVRVRESGLVQRNAPQAPNSSAEATGMIIRRIGFPGTTVPSENHPFDDYLDVPGFTLGTWQNVAANVVAGVIIGPGNPGLTGSAKGQIRTKVVEVLDSNGLPVPIVQMCTASGVDYRQ